MAKGTITVAVKYLYDASKNSYEEASLQNEI
jgi:hypothetical protein